MGVKTRTNYALSYTMTEEDFKRIFGGQNEDASTTERQSDNRDEAGRVIYDKEERSS